MTKEKTHPDSPKKTVSNAEPNTPKADTNSSKQTSPQDMLDSFSSEKIMTSALGDVPLKVSVVLGETSLSVEDLLRLRQGSTLPLHRRVDDLIEIYVHNQRVALGEIVALDNGLIGVAIREVMRATQSSPA